MPSRTCRRRDDCVNNDGVITGLLLAILVGVLYLRVNIRRLRNYKFAAPLLCYFPRH